MENQQKGGIHFQLGGLYELAMKATEVELFVAIAAKHHLNLFNSDTKQAFLHGDMGDQTIYICPQDWWQEQVQRLDNALSVLGWYDSHFNE